MIKFKDHITIVLKFSFFSDMSFAQYIAIVLGWWKFLSNIIEDIKKKPNLV